MRKEINPNSNFPVYISKPDPNDAHYPPQSTPNSSSVSRRYSNSSVNTDMVLPGSYVNLLQMNINPYGYKAGIYIACDSYLNPHASPFLPKCTVSTLMAHQTKYVLNSALINLVQKGCLLLIITHLLIPYPTLATSPLDTGSPREMLQKIKLINPSRLIIGQLNINSLSNKLEHLKALIIGNIDILVVTESKLDQSFPTGQFNIDGYSPPLYYDRNSFGGWGYYICERRHSL